MNGLRKREEKVKEKRDRKNNEKERIGGEEGKRKEEEKKREGETRGRGATRAVDAWTSGGGHLYSSHLHGFRRVPRDKSWQ